MHLQDLYQRAMEYAANAHGEQRVPDKHYSYVVHLAEVAMEIMSVGKDVDSFRLELAVQCALLHDVIEDTNTSYSEVEGAFGMEVAQGVLALSKNHSLDKTIQLEDSLNRIIKQAKEVWMVKMADRITNLQKPPTYWTREKIISYKMESERIYERLKDANFLLASRLAEKINLYNGYID